MKQEIFNQSLTLNLRYREKWGSIYSYLVASQFLDEPDQNRPTLNTNINPRIIRGLSLRISGNFQLIRDQINLPKGEASIEDLLLRQRQISTNYQNRVSLGLSYTFGSIFNNVVNTRLWSTGQGLKWMYLSFLIFICSVITNLNSFLSIPIAYLAIDFRFDSLIFMSNWI